MSTYTAWLDGQPLETVNRKRHVTHAVAVLDYRREPVKWGVLSWHGSEEAARAQVATWQKIYPQIKVLGVSQRVGYVVTCPHLT